MATLMDTITVDWFIRHLEAFANTYPKTSLIDLHERAVLAQHLHGNMAVVVMNEARRLVQDRDAGRLA